MATGQQDRREISVYEIVDVIEDLVTVIGDYREDEPHKAPVVLAAEALVDKLVGPERESESRWSSKHIRVDDRYCEQLADSLAISVDEAYDYFIGEPIKRVEKVAAWALEKADEKILENGGVHGQRGRMVADMLQAWASTNHTGVYRRRQEERQATVPEEVA